MQRALPQQQRRFTLSALAALAAVSVLSAAGTAQAWSWTRVGSGEKVKGAGEVGSEARTPGAFEAVRLMSGFHVLVRQAGSDALEIKAEKNLLPYIETRIVDGGGKGHKTLEIGTKKGYQISATVPVQIVVSAMVLRGLAIDGSGEVRVESMKTPSIDATIAGSGDIRFAELFSERAKFSVAGSGDVLAKGRVNSLTVSVAGSGDVKAAELAADEVKISIAGSGDAQVRANKTLKVSIAGSGDVRYAGTPMIESSVAGSGSIKSLASASK